MIFIVTLLPGLHASPQLVAIFKNVHNKTYVLPSLSSAANQALTEPGANGAAIALLVKIMTYTLPFFGSQ